MIQQSFHNKISFGVLLLAALWAGPRVLIADGATLGSAEAASAIRETTRREFKRSRFCKPKSVDRDSKVQVFAPLIVEELGEHPGSTPPMGLIDPVGKRAIFEPGTVYYHKGEVQAGTETLNQFIYLWAYDRDGSQKEPQNDPIVRGVRVIVNSEGMPVVWEALEPGRESRIFYVASSIEAAARAEFGEPLSGSHFAIERSLDDGLGVVVARVLDDGPAPMGPYVYLDSSPDRRITTVLCRCSPSQFEDAVETRRYELLPIENVSATWKDRPMSEWIESTVAKSRPLDALFRWPKGAP